MQCKIIEPQAPFYAHHCNAKFRATNHYYRYAARNLIIPRQPIGEGYGGASYPSTIHASSLAHHKAVSRQHSREHLDTNSVTHSMNNSYHGEQTTAM